MRWMIALALAACGRVGFEPTSDDARLLTGDGGSGDGSSPPVDAMADAMPAACAEAIPVMAGTAVTVDTCMGMTDRVDGCGPAGTREVVFAFTAPTSTGYTFRAYNTGTTTVNNSTGRIDAACDAVTNCAGITGFPVSAGQTVYLAVEASSGGCATIDFLVD